MSVAPNRTHTHRRHPSPDGAPYTNGDNPHRRSNGWGSPPTLPPPQPEVTVNTVNTVSYAQQQLGASATEGMRRAYAECKAAVARIAAQCRAKNRKFRDVEFDLENDSQRCLHNLGEPNIFTTADVRRVAEIFANPVFYSGTPKSAEIVQGALDDSYLVSALSTMTSVERLIKNLCVARDEEVGVYGFLFYRDCYWVPVIIDDLLFTRVPKWEQLSTVEKELYHFEKDRYNATARKGSDSLYFARPTTEGETWVPLVEKAYAKIHGDYASVNYGWTCDAIEDMTGGVSNIILSKDIFDSDKFWNDELIKANQDRLFACWFKTLDGERSGVKNASVDGLVGNLSHSVVKAVEIRGKRFVVLRDPWGEAGWEGPWSDGSKEWTTEWLATLPELGHTFGGKGQFVMEYKDFLNVWQEIQRTLIFDSTWVMSSQWLHVSLPFPSVSAFSFGDISFTFSLPAPSPVIIVFNKYNTRYFKDIQGPCLWNLDFILAREGETEPLAESSYSSFYTRGVNVELDLEPGNYVVLGRLDPIPVMDKDYFKKGLANGWDRRLTTTDDSPFIPDYKPNPELLVTPVADILGNQYAKADKSTIDAVKKHAGHVHPGESITVTTTITTTQVISKSGKAKDDPTTRHGRHHTVSAPPPLNGYSMQPNGQGPTEPGWPRAGSVYPNPSPPGSPGLQPYAAPLPPLPPLDPPRPISPPLFPLPTDVLEDDHSIVVGLKVFTKSVAPTVITGRLKAGSARPAGTRYG
ncbi:hypothetical protein BJ912DRAFT_1085666 [Pholiota molesta]|nr:hypothetical protein BJ912DRAFT_1085666 [Pholiota molesta]